MKTPATSPGEFELIDVFTSQFDLAPSPRGPGDDCAVIPPSKFATCVTTDSVLDGVHFRRGTFSYEDIGHKALAVNLSDLAAMGAIPQWALCSLQVPHDMTAADLKALGAGMAALARTHHVSLIGGNYCRAQYLGVTLTVSGKLTAAPLLRSGAKPGDALYVSGPLGDAAAGLAVLLRENPSPRFQKLTRAQRRPSPHVAMGRFLTRFASSCIDVSDGLLQDLGHIAKSSRVGFAVNSPAIPLSADLQAHFPADEQLRFALSGGEDYVLAFTVSQTKQKAFERALRRSQFSAFHIGYATKVKALTVDGKPVAANSGFHHR